MIYRINVVGRLNGFGLNQDAAVVTDALLAAGMNVTHSEHKKYGSYWRHLDSVRRFDANLFLERVHTPWLGQARKNFLIPNQERFPTRHIPLVKKIDTIFCKSLHATNTFSKLGAESQFIGFNSRDRLNAKTNRMPGSILHMAGKSSDKGTEEILSLWNEHPGWPTLTLLQHPSKAPSQVPDNVNLITAYQSDEQIGELLNSHQIHLCPSRMEGWGHYLVEALSTGATVIATDAPPMNEIVSSENALLVQTNGSRMRHLGYRYSLDRSDLKRAILQALTLSSAEHREFGTAARHWYEENNAEFGRRFVAKMVQSLWEEPPLANTEPTVARS